MVGVFVTYNSVGRSLENRRYERNGNYAYIFQGFLRKEGRSSSDMDEKRRVLVEQWSRMGERLAKDKIEPEDVDYLVLNCGKWPNLAMGLPKAFRSQNVFFVHCLCPQNQAFEPPSKLRKAGYIYTACGGIETMERIYEGFMNTNRVVSYMTVEEAMRPKGV